MESSVREPKGGCVHREVLFYYGCVSMVTTIVVVYLQIFAGNYFTHPRPGVPNFSVDMYYVTMGAYWSPIYPLTFWWCYLPFYFSSVIPILCYFHDLAHQKMYIQMSIVLVTVGFCTLIFALIQYCTAITQGLLVYENMVTASNEIALQVSVDWVKGSKYLFVTAISSLFVMFLYAIMNLCILVCPFVFTLPINYIAIGRCQSNSMGMNRGGLKNMSIQECLQYFSRSSENLVGSGFSTEGESNVLESKFPCRLFYFQVVLTLGSRKDYYIFPSVRRSLSKKLEFQKKKMELPPPNKKEIFVTQAKLIMLLLSS